MGTHGDTRRAAFTAACALAAAGERPSVAAVRARLGGRGGQQAVQAGVNDWVEEAARRFQLPALPDVLQSAVVAFWETACQTARDQWDAERAELLAQRDARDQQLAALAARHAALEGEQARALQDNAELAQSVDTTRTALYDAHQHLRVRETEVSDLNQRLGETQAQAARLEEAHAALADQVRALEAAERRQQEALQRAERARDHWQGQARRAEQSVARLEQAGAEARRDGERLTTALTEAQGALAAGRTALEERETRLQTLATLLERSQATHEAESAHWLVQIDDQRQALSAAREREQRGERERAALWQQVQTLTQVLRERAPGNAGPDGRGGGRAGAAGA